MNSKKINTKDSIKGKQFLQYHKQIALGLIFITFTSCSDKNDSDGNDKWTKLPIIAFNSTDSQGNTVVTCDYSLVKDTIDFELSSLLSDFDVIGLSNQDEALITEGNTTVSEKYLGIYVSQLSEYKLFSRKGDFITNISSKGQGVNEFSISIYDSYIDEIANRVYLLPMVTNKILVSDLQGNMQDPIQLPYTVPKGRIIVNTSEKEVTVMVLPFKESTLSVVWKQDFEGNIIQEIPAQQFAVQPDYSNEIDCGQNTTAMSFSIFHWDATIDTLYRYNEIKNGLSPVFTVRFPDTPLQHEYIELPHYYLIRMIPENQSVHYPLICIDKKTLRGAFVRLNADFLGGIRGAYWIDFKRGYYIINNYAYNLKEEIENKLKDQHLDQSHRDRLELINNNITEESNNIFFIGRLRTDMISSFAVHDINIYLQETLPERETPSKVSTPAITLDDDRVYGVKMDDLKEIRITGSPKGDFKEYFKTNNIYKDWSDNDKKEVGLTFVIEKDGSASNVKVNKSSENEKLDKEAVRLIQNMEFSPAIHLETGKPVRSRFAMPVFFPPQE
ncbi:TonB family protein [Parabacteroides sp. OttesenSCG-928-G07]|nr:TonB family protein [Parabacteroides sp. OttesenSCG-928-G07]